MDHNDAVRGSPEEDSPKTTTSQAKGKRSVSQDLQPHDTSSGRKDSGFDEAREGIMLVTERLGDNVGKLNTIDVVWSRIRDTSAKEW